MSSKILLTGATSLIGRSIVEQLEQRGDTVTCFQRTNDGRPSTITGDVRDASQVLSAVKGHDAVIHLAALVSPKPAFHDALAVNVDGAVNVARAARDCGRLVHISSPSVAFHHEGSIGAAALPPTYRGRDAYTHTKALGEEAVLRVHGLNTIVIRPHLVYGPSDEQLIGRLLDRALSGTLAIVGSGTALIDTTYVDDAAAGILAALDRTADAPQLGGRAFVVSGGDPRPITEVFSAILDAFDVQPRLRHLPVGVARKLGQACDRWWRGGEPPLTEFAVEQLSLAHSFDLRKTRDELLFTPQWSFARSMDALRCFGQSQAGQEFLDRRRHRSRG